MTTDMEAKRSFGFCASYNFMLFAKRSISVRIPRAAARLSLFWPLKALTCRNFYLYNVLFAHNYINTMRLQWRHPFLRHLQGTPNERTQIGLLSWQAWLLQHGPAARVRTLQLHKQYLLSRVQSCVKENNNCSLYTTLSKIRILAISLLRTAE